MYKLCKTEETVKRQREIELGLFSMLKTVRFDNLSITELCEKIQIPRKAFYRYFDSKEDALCALIDHTMVEYSGFSGDLMENKRRSLILELEVFFDFWYDKRELLSVLHRSDLLSTLMDRIINYPIHDRIAMVKFLPEEDDKMRKMVFKFAICGLSFMMIEWYKDGFKTPARDMAKAACRMFGQPLFPSLETAGFDINYKI